MNSKIKNKEINTSNNKKRKKKKEEYRGYQLVYQGNRLIEAKYDLTLQEKRLLLFAISRIKAEKFKVEPITFSCRELSDLCEIDKDSYYRELKKTTAKIMSRVFVVKNLDEQTYTQLNWVTRSKYYEKEGIVEIKFNDDLGQFLLDLKSNFTSIPLSQTLNLSSVYAIRMFELLKQYETIGERTFSVENLRETLGVKKEKLQFYKDFKNKVILISQRELALKTDICFEFEEIKRSRKVDSLRFLIYKNDPNKPKIENKKGKKIKNKTIFSDEKNELLELGFSNSTILKFFNNFSTEQIKTALSVVLDQIKKGNTKNPKALFQKALNEGWSLDHFTNSKDE